MCFTGSFLNLLEISIAVSAIEQSTPGAVVARGGEACALEEKGVQNKTVGTIVRKRGQSLRRKLTDTRETTLFLFL